MNAFTQISTSNAIALPVVIVRDGGVFANSRDVADYFDKRHADVIRSIDDLLMAAPAAEREFAFCPYSAVSGGREYRSFDLTRDGFTLFAMGFTGPRALHFKLAYIDAFNQMEALLRSERSAVPAIPTTLTEALRLAADEAEKRERTEAELQLANAELEHMAPKADAFDSLMSAEGTFSSTEVANHLGFRSAQALHTHLHAEGVLRKGRRGQWLLRAAFARSGYFKLITQRYGNSVRTHTAWTPSGLAGRTTASIRAPLWSWPGCNETDGRGAPRSPPKAREPPVYSRKPQPEITAHPRSTQARSKRSAALYRRVDARSTFRAHARNHP
ncbi:phage regulatory protein/antirepressor Ant [Kaistia terrae]|uniref:Rha family transcriptional regulator n=1 Tax=Kaistia terrae TaxID=537017 RepID=A0ABW0PXC5_9HYPH|nr:phage regulatory protein/antirepressor Ant [Kaistia terrae]MCX5580784.1 phage regulatory protein/antirepressor Ant [Kaistia terrae]